MAALSSRLLLLATSLMTRSRPVIYYESPARPGQAATRKQNKTMENIPSERICQRENKKTNGFSQFFTSRGQHREYQKSHLKDFQVNNTTVISDLGGNSVTDQRTEAQQASQTFCEPTRERCGKILVISCWLKLVVILRKFKPRGVQKISHS